MSFSASVKKELSGIDNMPVCCTHAFAYGMLLFGRAFNSRSISIMTEHECVASKYSEMIYKTCGLIASVHVSEAEKYSINIENKKDIEKILSEFSSNGNESIVRINRGNLLNENENAAS